MRKLITIMLCATIPLLTFVGCGEEDKSVASSQASNISSDSEILNSDTSLATEEATEKSYLIQEGTSFSDGYAWVSFEEKGSSGEKLSACINKSGEIQFFTDEYYLNEWHDGTCIVGEKSYDYSTECKIINTKNEVLFETNETFTNILAYGDGYYAISKYVHNLESKKYLIYFLDTDGNWFDTNYDLNLENEPEVGYLGEKIFLVGDVYINLNTKQATEYTDYNCYNMFGKFQDGVAVTGNSTLIYTDGTTKTLELNGGTVQGPISDGGFVYSNSDGDNNVLYFYDISTGNSNKITSYSKDIIYQNGGNLYFEDGYLFLSLQGIDYKNYITFLDKNGNEVFEPIPYDHIGSLSENYIVAYSYEGAVRTSNIFDNKGNMVLKTDKYLIDNNFHNNCVQVQNESHHQSYMDIDGNLLFDKLTYNDTIYNIVL